MKNDPNYVQVGTDKDGNPLYQSVSAATFPLSIVADNHAESRTIPAGDAGKSNVSAVFIELRGQSSLKN